MADRIFPPREAEVREVARANRTARVEAVNAASVEAGVIKRVDTRQDRPRTLRGNPSLRGRGEEFLTSSILNTSGYPGRIFM